MLFLGHVKCLFLAALGWSVDCKTIDWLVGRKTLTLRQTEYTPKPNIHQGRLYTKVDWKDRQNISPVSLVFHSVVTVSIDLKNVPRVGTSIP